MNNFEFINIHQISTGFIEVPGKISINIYAQGCKMRCPKCQNPQCQSFDGGMKFLISDIDSLKNDYPLSTWICWLGGDAVYQPDKFVAFNKEFIKRGYNIALYTGMQFHDAKHLLDDVLLVIDGEWKNIPVQDKNSNQTIWVRFDLESDFRLTTDWESLKTFI